MLRVTLTVIVVTVNAGVRPADTNMDVRRTIWKRNNVEGGKPCHVAIWFSFQGRLPSDSIPVTNTSEQAVTAGLTGSDCLNSIQSSESFGGKLQNKDLKLVLLN